MRRTVGVVLIMAVVLAFGGCRRAPEETAQDKIDAVLDSFEGIFTGESNEELAELFADQVTFEIIGGDSMEMRGTQLAAMLAGFSAEIPEQVGFRPGERAYAGEYTVAVTATLRLETDIVPDAWQPEVTLREIDEEWKITRVRTTVPELPN